MEKLWQGKNKKYMIGAVTVVSVFIFMKYILTLVMPFFLAFCLVSGLQPVLRRLEEKLHIRKGLLALLLLAAVTLVLGTVFWCCVVKLCSGIGDLSQNMKHYESSLTDFVSSCCQRLEHYIGISATKMEDAVYVQVNQFTKDMRERALPKLMDKSVIYVRLAIATAGFLAMTLIATVLLAKDFGKIQTDLRRFEWFLKAEEIGREVGRLAVDYLKAQIRILSIIGAISALTLWLIGIRYGAAVGLLAGIMDALPFIGTGCVLLPIALWQLIQGKVWQCGAILLLYIGCVVLREFLEPKLIGKQMDIYPVVVLLAIYVGIEIYGLAGVVKGPLSFLLIREIWRKIPDYKTKTVDFGTEMSDFYGDD